VEGRWGGTEETVSGVGRQAGELPAKTICDAREACQERDPARAEIPRRRDGSFLASGGRAPGGVAMRLERIQVW